ncbi:MAG: ribbon-helix-helix domain-containing protein [Limnohabitans sp.]
MCEYFVKADPIQYEQRTRSVRIRGMLTSIRLENMVWDVLAEMAEDEGCTTNALICKLHDEILQHRGEVPNFASFLRVTSLRFLRRCLINLERQYQPADGQESLAVFQPPVLLTRANKKTVPSRAHSNRLAAVKT